MPGSSVTPRYPVSLSQAASGPSRPSRSARYETEVSSIDDEVPSPPVPTTPYNPHEYSSLADMLQKAGYKETRVFTPEAERARSRIKKTFDDEDEITSLYGVYGFEPRNISGMKKINKRNGHEHRIQHVTEPTLPIKSSTSILRSLALQDVTTTTNKEVTSSGESWWGGGLAALGLKKGSPEKVVEVEPVGLFGTSTSVGVGLGLANGGQGVRKVKSAWELESSRPQEERPPMPRISSSPQDDTPTRYPGFGYSYNQDPPPAIASMFSSPPPPPALDDDAYGYCPLPVDYEAQTEEDEALYDMSYPPDVFSLGSSSSRHSIDESSAADASGNGGFKGILEGAVEYSEEAESPPVVNQDLPPERTQPVRSSTSPEPAVEVAPKVLKYADRATRLRIAKSSPTLVTAKPSWLGSLRTAFLGNQSTSQPIPIEPIPAIPSRFRLSPAVPAAPTLITASPVVCDSTSTEAEDLPPIQTPTLPQGTISPAAVMNSIALRLRPSIQTLKEAVGLPTSSLGDDGTSPTLSPRLDFSAQGEQFAGWGWEQSSKSRPEIPWISRFDKGATPVENTVTDSATTPETQELEIDYSKSFFYKPPTPPRNKDSQETNQHVPPSPEKPQPRRQRSIKSLRAALLIPVAPVPSIPDSLNPLSAGSKTPPLKPLDNGLVPPVLAILSPGAWEAGLPPRELVLEGEEWDAREGGVPGDWGSRGRVGRKKGKSLKSKRSKRAL